MNRYKSPKWQKKRLEVMSRDQWRCVACLDANQTLHVHHKRYDGELWDVDLEDLQTLCEPCHGLLGPHPKGGVWWARDRHGLLVRVEWCPLCGSCNWKDKGTYEKCVNCGWRTSVYSEFGVSILVNRPESNSELLAPQKTVIDHDFWDAVLVQRLALKAKMVQLKKDVLSSRLPPDVEGTLLERLVATRRKLNTCYAHFITEATDGR